MYKNYMKTKLILSFKEMFSWIELNPLLNKLWNFINKKGKMCYDWEFLFIRLIKEVMTPIILYKLDKIEKDTLNLNKKWFEYLMSRTTPYLQNFSPIVLRKIHTMAPVSDELSYNAQIHFLERIYEDNNLMDIYNSGADIYNIVKSFEDHFGNHYYHFLSRCTHLGNEWGLHEGKTYNNNLYSIFQLNNANTRTPPKIIEDTLIELIHVRNAPSHKDSCGIIPINDNEVRIRDKKPDRTITYDKTIPKEDLWKYFYKLISLDRGLDTFALYLDLFFELKNHNKNYNVIITCSCGSVYNVYFPPHISKILCKNCLKVHTRDKLKIIEPDNFIDLNKK